MLLDREMYCDYNLICKVVCKERTEMKMNLRHGVAFMLIAASLFSFFACGGGKDAETTESAQVTEAPEKTVETKVDENGILTNEYYYLGDELDYSVDYVYDEKTGSVTKITFDGGKDKNGNSILMHSERYEVNELGNLKYYCKKDKNNALITETEYIYYEDLETVWKETKKTYDGHGSFTAEKKLYSEDGKLTDVYVYEGTKEVSHTKYDENGNAAK